MSGVTAPLVLTLALDGSGDKSHAPAALPSNPRPQTLYGKVGGQYNLSGRGGEEKNTCEISDSHGGEYEV
jgi:hypothetical protein